MCSKGFLCPETQLARWHVALVGRNANNSVNASRFYWNLNNTSGNANQNIGSQLSLFRNDDCDMENLASWQNTRQTSLGVGRAEKSRRLRGEISRQ